MATTLFYQHINKGQKARGGGGGRKEKNDPKGWESEEQKGGKDCQSFTYV